jgi:AcrR family transcriptional regulator
MAAAAKLFLQLGYGNTSTAAIGRAANTSEATVFAVFGSKAELLVDVIGEQATSDPAFPLRESAIWQRFAAGQETTAVIQEFARVVRGAHDRSWQLLALAAAAAHDDPTVATAVARGAAGRLADCGWFLQQVVGIPESDLGRLTDAVWTLISVDNYRHLVVDRSWPCDQYESWLVEMLTASLR